MKYFTLDELTRTNKPIKNTPTMKEVENLEFLVDLILDPARENLRKPITVSSGFRNPEVNRAVGGSSTSQHLKGEAADLTCYDNKKLFEIIRQQGKFDQLIWEYGTDREPAWVHVSVSKYGRNRREVLRCKTINGKASYIRM